LARLHPLSSAKAIFSAWLERLGRVDKYEELRIAIIEGQLARQEPGYSITIGSNVEAIRNRAIAEGRIAPTGTVVAATRIHRMAPSVGSPHLAMFRASYERHSHYGLMPMLRAQSDDGQITPLSNFVITKRQLHFRTIDDISDDDVDSVIFSRRPSSRF
jgi:hypothetical protein